MEKLKMGKHIKMQKMGMTEMDIPLLQLKV